MTLAFAVGAAGCFVFGIAALLNGYNRAACVFAMTGWLLVALRWLAALGA